MLKKEWVTTGKKENLSGKQKKIISASVIVAVILFSGAATWFIGKPMINFVSEPEKFRLWVNESGIWSRFVFVGMTAFQVIIALIPGEPLELGAGYAFGAIEGTFLCVIGVTIGSVIVFFLVRRYGVKLVEVFFTYEKIKSLKFLHNEKKLSLTVLIVFLLPGTPKDLLTYFVGLTKIKASKFLAIVSLARIPSIITSTMGGGALGEKDYKAAVIVLAVTAAISIIGWIIYKIICDKRNKKER